MGGKSLAGGDAGAAWEVVMEANLINGRKSRSIHEMTFTEIGLKMPISATTAPKRCHFWTAEH